MEGYELYMVMKCDSNMSSACEKEFLNQKGTLVMRKNTVKTISVET